MLKPSIKRYWTKNTAHLLAVTSLAVLALTGTAHASKQITINNGKDPESLDTAKVTGLAEFVILRQMFEGLVNKTADGQIVPAIATSWETVDNKTWTFHLRQDAKWSDGEPVTAHDFVYAWRRLVSPEIASSYASYMASDMKLLNAQAVIEGRLPADQLGVEALDDWTLRLTLFKEVPYLPEMVAIPPTFPLPKKVIEQYGERWTMPEHIVVNGAYKLTDWVVNSHIDMARNPRYWNDSSTQIDTVRFYAINRESDDMNRYLSHGEDISSGIPSEMMDKFRQERPEEVKILPTSCVYYYQYNLRRPPFDDKRVRQALNMALDREVIVDKILRLGQQPLYNLTPNFINGYVSPYVPSWSTKPMSVRLALAKQLLTEAGYSPEHPLEFDLLYNTAENHRRIAVAVASMYKKLGMVKVNLINQEWKSYLATRKAGNYHMVRGGWCAEYNAPTAFQKLLLSDSSLNEGNYHSAEYDAAVNATFEAGLSAQELGLRYQHVSQIASEDAVTIPVYSYTMTRLVRPYVKGYPTIDPLSNLYVKDLELQENTSKSD